MIGSAIALAGHGLISSTVNENALCMLLFYAALHELHGVFVNGSVWGKQYRLGQ